VPAYLAIMISKLLAFVAFLILFYNPIYELLTPSAPKIRRTARPQINEDLLALESPRANQTQCAPNSYSVHVFSREPLVLYIENFLTLAEREHLLEIRFVVTIRLRRLEWTIRGTNTFSDPIFEPSTITHNGGNSAHRDATVRDSEVAVIPRTDAVRCVEDRARALQGWRDQVWIERLRVQRYQPGGHYDHHFDWSSGRGGWGRVSSFMAWVDNGDGELLGGGTEFPLLKHREDPRWCAFVECPGPEASGSEVNPGVVFKPLPGNAVYWENFQPDGTGRGYEETWHAGLPVTTGVKVGLNIWSWGRID
jgi:prolyl 4-hydroxylase